MHLRQVYAKEENSSVWRKGFILIGSLSDGAILSRSEQEERFRQFLENQPGQGGGEFRATTAYIGAIKNVPKRLNDPRLKEMCIFDIKDKETFDSAYSAIVKSSDFKEIDRKYGHGAFHAGLMKYKLFLEKETSTDEIRKKTDPPSQDDTELKKITSFLDLLESKHLRYSAETIENFLLSLKVKPFVILTGPSGTGKTKLAQFYGEHISGYERQSVSFKVTIGESATSGGWTLSADHFKDHFPELSKREIYDIIVDGINGRGRLEPTPRLFYAESNEIKNHLEKLSHGNKGDKIDLKIFFNGKSQQKHSKIIAVGANWTDGRYLLGYDNIIAQPEKYVTTDALDLIISANEDRTTPRMLILDEMNLSHVERYFSNFLSAMESGKEIRLHSRDNEEIVPQTVSLTPNILVVGTVNMDETTYTFSPKVLDRANVIEFSSLSVKEYLVSGNRDIPKGNAEYLSDVMRGSSVREKGAKEILEELRHSGMNTDAFIRDLNEIQHQLSEISQSFSYRTIDEILRFMLVAWEYERKKEFLNWERYFDAQIMQKILPKIHGTKSIESTLGRLYDICNGKYKKSAVKIDYMINLLRTQRYVSFVC